MSPTDFSHFPDQPKLRPLDRPRHQTIRVQHPVRAPAMIIRRDTHAQNKRWVARSRGRGIDRWETAS